MLASVPVPVLNRRKVTGYRNGVAIPDLTLVVVAPGKNSELEENAALDYILMRRAARKAGVALELVAGWRSHELQASLYLDRQDPQRRALLGPAAMPGYSKHESGRAADISVGLSIKQYADGYRTAAFTWLQANCERYGWVWVGGQINPIEPWHYEHNGDAAVGPIDTEEIPELVSTDSCSRNAADVNRSVLATLQAREMHDALAGLKRADAMSKSSRKLLYDAAAAEAVGRGAKAQAAQAGATTNAKKLDEPVHGFTEATIKNTCFDFTTGLWGDGKPV